jgi:RNA polymerase sigma-70 factor (ECF subfamily)
MVKGGYRMAKEIPASDAPFAGRVKSEPQQETNALPFTAMVAAYEAPLGRYLTRLVDDPDLARDLLQDTLLSAYRALATTQPAQPRAWLYRIATNHALAHFRRRRLIAWLPLSRLPYSARMPSVAGHAEQVTTETAIVEALAALDPRERACLLLDAAGFTGNELAEQLGCSLAAARMRLSRARVAVRRHYHREDQE